MDKHALVESQAKEMDLYLTSLQHQLQVMMTSSVESMGNKIKKENEDLTKIIEKLKEQISISDTATVSLENADPVTADFYSSTNGTIASSDSAPIFEVEKKATSESRPQKSKKKEKTPKKAVPEDLQIDVGRLDFRIGRITSIQKHPDADSLYVEQIELGEDKPRTVVSGLVKFMSADYLNGRMVVVLCNLKPQKMRGITSEAMVMCACTPEKIEVLIPPAGSNPGDLVDFQGYERRPDSVLNPKRKIFETCAPDLKTNGDLIATYKGIAFNVEGKGVVKTESLLNVQIK